MAEIPPWQWAATVLMFLNICVPAATLYVNLSSTNLATQPVFSTIQSGIAGQTGTTGYMDTNAAGNGSFCYPVGVQQ
jgi:hypothetical protein